MDIYKILESLERVNELFEPTTEYYTLSNGKTIQVEYRPSPNMSPLPGSMSINYVDPKVMPTNGPSNTVTDWQSAPEDIKQAIVKWASSPQSNQSTQQQLPSQKVAQQQTQEDSMAAAEHHKSGAKFGGYWKGTQKSPPRPGQGVGGACESVEERLTKKWNKFKLDEFGANNPQQGQQQDPIKQKQIAQQTQNVSQAFQKLGNTAGIKTGVGASQAAKTAVANANNPNINPTTGAGMDQTGKKITGTIGKGVEDALVAADPADANKLVQDLQKIKQKSAGTH
jgi:hypothetical protein